MQPNAGWAVARNKIATVFPVLAFAQEHSAFQITPDAGEQHFLEQPLELEHWLLDH